MFIKIVGFKCHVDTSYQIEPNGMILLKGPSGAGKSTILQAIYWALYGSMRGIYNNTGEIKKCSVTIRINQLVIYRQKRPELLQVTILDGKEEKTYEDVIAQQIISQSFGSKELWKSCSYIGQKERCSLLSGSATERMTLLNQLSFNMDNPKDYINRIDQELKQVNQQFLTIQTAYTTEVNLFSQEINNRPIKVNISDSDIEKLKTDIADLELDTNRLYQEVLTHERNSGQYNMIKSQISDYENQLQLLPKINFDKNTYQSRVDQLTHEIRLLRQIQDNITNYKSALSHLNSKKQQQQTLTNQLESIKNKIIESESNINLLKDKLGDYDFNNPISVTQQTIWSVKNQEQQRHQYITECQQLGCEYNQPSISNMISEYQKKINENDNIKRNLLLHQKYQDIINQLNTIDLDITDEKINQLQESNNNIALEISELKKGLEMLKCPSCSVSLRYINNQLVTGDVEPVSPQRIQLKQNEYQSNMGLINKIRNALQLKHQATMLKDQIDSNFDPNATYEDTSKYNQLITRLTRLQIIDKPLYSSEYLSLVLTYNNNVTQYKTLLSTRDNLKINLEQIDRDIGNINLPDIPNENVDINTIMTKESELRKLHDDHNSYIKQQATISQLNVTIHNLKEQLSNIILNPAATTIYETHKSLLSDNKTKLDEALYTCRIRKRQGELEVKRQEVLSLNSDLISLGRLKQNAINIECKQLQDTVDTINQTLGDILPLFFNDPIDMELRLYKEMKTKKQVKPGLTINIKYKGVEYDNINMLSGGEGDRISLALVLSLNQVSSSPLVLLDECISSLDGKLKESCIEVMKQFQYKTIICVDHEGVEGYYDRTITVKS